MEIKRIVIFLLGILLLEACDNPVNLSPKGLGPTDEELKTKILYEGDTLAYNTFIISMPMVELQTFV